MKIYWLLFFTSALLINACADISPIKEQPSLSCDVEFVILGIWQDGGSPQIGNPDDPCLLYTPYAADDLPRVYLRALYTI